MTKECSAIIVYDQAYSAQRFIFALPVTSVLRYMLGAR